MKLYHGISPVSWPGIHKNNATAYIFFWIYFLEPILHRPFISHSPESRREEKNDFHLFTKKQKASNQSKKQELHFLHCTQLCDTSSDFYDTIWPAEWCFTQLMWPYWKVNKEAWSLANKRWVCYKGDTFELAGRKRGRGGKIGRRHLLRALLACHNLQSRDEGPLWGFTTTTCGASRARTCSKVPCKVLSPEPHGKPRACFSAWG